MKMKKTLNPFNTPHEYSFTWDDLAHMHNMALDQVRYLESVKCKELSFLRRRTNEVFKKLKRYMNRTKS
jgi:hypothetical protein